MDRPHQTIFITATDTDAGKTWITASAIRHLLQQGQHAKALKPIACGVNASGINDDIATLLYAQGLGGLNQIEPNQTEPNRTEQSNQADSKQINLFNYPLAAAPAQAAAAQQETINTQKLVQWCKAEADKVDTCLIEGVGGLMVPITHHWLLADWIEAMPDAEIWLVVGCKLGAINQTLLTLDKLKHMHRSPQRIFFNATAETYNPWIRPTQQAVEPFLDQHCMVHGVHYTEEPCFPQELQ